MKIILDSNVLYGDFLLKSGRVLTLETYLSQTQTSDELCFPEIVIRETIRHYHAEYQEAFSNYKRTAELFQIIGKSFAKIPNSDEAEKLYYDQLNARLRELKARILPIPSTPAELLFERYLTERRPFLAKGEGFSDVLIWESILAECHKHDEKIIFVTEDFDFASSVSKDQDPKLHPDLVDDLEEAGFDKDRVSLIRGLNVFNEKFVHPLLPRVYPDSEPSEGKFLEKIDIKSVLVQSLDVVQSRLHTALSALLDLKRSSVDEITLLRWAENEKLIEAFDLGGRRVRLLAESLAVVDVKFLALPEDFLAIFKHILFLLDNRWDEKEQRYEIKGRMRPLVVQVSFICRQPDNVIVTTELKQIGFVGEEPIQV